MTDDGLELLKSSGICYCCTCELDWQWDPMCRLHGAHGFRACETHDLPREECECDRCNVPNQ